MIGIMPEGFQFPWDDIEVWIPFQHWPSFNLNRNNGHGAAVGRIKPGISIEAAQTELKAIAARLARQYPESNADRSVDLVLVKETVVADIRSSLFVLMGAVGFVLLIACANVANLLLVYPDRLIYVTSMSAPSISPFISTIRAPLIGMPFCVVVSVGGQYIANVLNAPNIAYAHLPHCLLIPFLILVLMPNALLKMRFRQLALTSRELVLIFAMGLIASIAPDWAMNWYLMAVITAPYYYASVENQWETKFFDYLPDWLVLDYDAARGFFEGIGPGRPIPWHDWATPLFWWGSFIVAMLFVGACLVVMLRKQWVEHEKLRFPLGEIAIHLIGAERDGKDDSAWPPFYRTSLFRTGFITMLMLSLYNCTTYWTGWSHFPIMGGATDTFILTIDPAYPAQVFRLNIFSLCFAFFINVEILFSLWFFQIFSTLQAGYLNRIGMTSTTLVPGGLVSIEFIGGMIFFVLWGIWMARRHLWSVVCHAFGRPSELDDRNELFSYRTAVFGLIIGFLYIMYWLHHAGVAFLVIALFLFFLFVFYLAVARVMAEAGLVMIDLPINANQFTVGMIGSANVSTPTITGMALTNAFARNWRTFTMIAISHAAWFKDYLGKSDFGESMEGKEKATNTKPDEVDTRWDPGSSFFLWMCMAFGIGSISSLGYLIWAGYRYGEQSLRGGAIGSLGNGFYAMAIAWIDNATRITELEVAFLVGGGIMTFIMTIGRYLFYWWPLHPIGFVVAAAAPIRSAFFPFFLAWLIQVLLLRFGGVRLYQKAQPLFLGMLVGYLIGAGVSYTIDIFWFPDTPHLYENFF